MAENPKLFQAWNAELRPPENFTDVTLRDLFAGLAMQAISTSEEAAAEVWVRHKEGGKPYNTEWAELSYELADAMLAAREEADRG